MALSLPYPTDEPIFIHLTPEVIIDREDRVIIVHKRRIPLTVKEYAVLGCLVEAYLSTKSHRWWCPMSQLEEAAYPTRSKKEKSSKTKHAPEPLNTADAVRKIIWRIRQKVVYAYRGAPDIIECRPGIGYRLLSPPPSHLLTEEGA